MKTPAPQRAASRKKLAAAKQALPDGSYPIPTVDYLKKAIRSVGRAPASKRPALKALIRKRAAELKATNAPGVKGTWAFQASNDGGSVTAIELVGPHGYEHGWIKVGGEPEVDRHVSAAKKAESEGDHANAISHLGSAAASSGDAKTAAHLAGLRNEIATKNMREHTAAAATALKAGDRYGALRHLSAATAPGHLTGQYQKMKITQPAEFKAVNAQAKVLAAKIMGKPAPKRKKASVRAHANDDTGVVIDMATATTRKMPMVRGAADVQLSRTGPGQISAMHKSTGMKIGTITPQGHGYAGTHADGKATGASGGQQGALAGLIAYHNQMAAKAKAGMAAGAPKTFTAGERDAVDLAGALPTSTPAASAMDGPRATSMGAGKPAATPASGAPSGLSPYGMAIYRKFIAKGMKPAVALAFAKRADAMHGKAAKAA